MELQPRMMLTRPPIIWYLVCHSATQDSTWQADLFKFRHLLSPRAGTLSNGDRGWFLERRRFEQPRLPHTHPEEKLDITASLLELVQDQFHGFDRRHACQRATQDHHLGVLVGVIEQLLFARA
jgi:hypothetical protein